MAESIIPSLFITYCEQSNDTYKCAFDEYYDTYSYVDDDGNVIERQYTRFEGSLFGQPNQNMSSALGIGLSNNIEAKINSFAIAFA